MEPILKPSQQKKLKGKRPKMSKRKDFPRHVREEAYEIFNGICAHCSSAEAADPHHIFPRSSGGKGVLTNCLPVCRSCHDAIEDNPELQMKWRAWAKEKHGTRYWMDEWDKRDRLYMGED